MKLTIGIERSENDILSLIVEEIEAKSQPLQEPLEFLQQEEKLKEQERRGMTCHQIHTNNKGHNGEPVKDAKYYVDNLGIPHLSHLKQKAKWDVPPNNQQPLVHSAVSLTDVDHQIITANLKFDPTSSTASMHYTTRNVKPIWKNSSITKSSITKSLDKHNPPWLSS